MTGVELTLLGDAEMTITDAQGRRCATEGGLMAGYANTIPGANLVEVEGRSGRRADDGRSIHRLVISGTAENGCSAAAATTWSKASSPALWPFPGVPVTTTTTAVLTLDTRLPSNRTRC